MSNERLDHLHVIPGLSIDPCLLHSHRLGANKYSAAPKLHLTTTALWLMLVRIRASFAVEKVWEGCKPCEHHVDVMSRKM